MRILSTFVLCLAAVAPLAAQTVVTPGNTTGNPFTAPGQWSLNDAKNCPGVCPGVDPAQITNANLGPSGSGGTGSLQFTITGGGTQPAATYVFGTAVSLSSLGAGFNLGYSFLTPAGNAPAGGGGPTIRLLLTGISDVAGSTRTDGSLGFYDANPTGNWETDLFTLTNGNFFFRVGGANGQANVGCASSDGSFDGATKRQTISSWTSACNGTGGTFDIDTALIYGVEVDWGSFAATSTVNSYADLINFNIGSNSVDADFETSAAGTSTVPEPATLSLLATGLVGLAGAARRKRSR